MTVTLERIDPWRTRPGWGISADLTPPEVVEERSLARLRRRLGLALVALLVVVLGGFLLALRQVAVAEASLEREQAETVSLRARAAEFRDISESQRILTRIRGQVAALMVGDVDVDALSRRMTEALPGRMTITSESISVNSGGAAAATGTPPAAEPDPAAPGESAEGGAAAPEGGAVAASTIGTVTLAGRARTLAEVAAYVERLDAIPGVTDVVPTSSTASESGVDYTATMNLTSRLLSHRFDLEQESP